MVPHDQQWGTSIGTGQKAKNRRHTRRELVRRRHLNIMVKTRAVYRERKPSAGFPALIRVGPSRNSLFPRLYVYLMSEFATTAVQLPHRLRELRILEHYFVHALTV